MLAPLRSRTGVVLAACIAFGLSLLALPAVADAATANIRIEAVGFPLVSNTTITLPTDPVAPPGALPGQTCPGNSVIGAIHAASGGDWSGTWSDTTGWSLERIKSVNIPSFAPRRWFVILNNEYVNEPPCQKGVDDQANLIVYPACDGGTSQCFTAGPLKMTTTPKAGPGVRQQVQVVEYNTVFNSAGWGTTGFIASGNAAVAGPNDSMLTDPYYGQGYATVLLTERGDNLITASKAGRASDRATVCVTDNNDGFCGSPTPDQVPFNPFDFCNTTGQDGLCGTVDKTPPIGRIASPKPGQSFTANAHPKILKGITEHDPSEVTQVNLRLLRKSRIPGTKVVKKKVTVKKRVKGKLVKRRVVKKVRVKVRRLTCFSWSTTKSDFVKLKSCSVQPNAWFKADGDEAWSFEFLSELPGGVYTLDAQAVDGAGNVDSTPEDGRNHVTFTLK